MPIITGVRFRIPGKLYYFDPGDTELKKGQHVIVETVRGMEYGEVVLPNREVPEEELKQPVKPIIRAATEEDDAREAANREKEENAFQTCKRKIREHGLEMKLVAAEYTFDNSKLLFYFTADGRIDFRELVKDLAGVFRTRIELRQIGVRDETKIVGGIGTCGRPLCCHLYLHEFAPVSIRMAKEQNLSLNPTKISGTCGRLMCCLKNEQETYEFLNKSLPRKGDAARTPDGLVGDVLSVNILRQTVRVIVEVENDEKEMREYPVSEITFIPRKGRKKRTPEEEAQELEALALAEGLAELESSDEAFAAEEAESIPDEAEKAKKKRKRKHRGHGKKTEGGAEGGEKSNGAPRGQDGAKGGKEGRGGSAGKSGGQEGKGGSAGKGGGQEGKSGSGSRSSRRGRSRGRGRGAAGGKEQKGGGAPETRDPS